MIVNDEEKAARMGKLPKWAQNEIARLNANLRRAEGKVERALGNHDPRYPSYGDYDDSRGRSLPCRTVWFREAGISVRASADGVEVFGDGQLSVHPHVTNRITLKSDYVDRSV